MVLQAESNWRPADLWALLSRAAVVNAINQMPVTGKCAGGVGWKGLPSGWLCALKWHFSARTFDSGGGPVYKVMQEGVTIKTRPGRVGGCHPQHATRQRDGTACLAGLGRCLEIPSPVNPPPPAKGPR